MNCPSRQRCNGIEPNRSQDYQSGQVRLNCICAVRLIDMPLHRRRPDFRHGPLIWTTTRCDQLDEWYKMSGPTTIFFPVEQILMLKSLSSVSGQDGNDSIHDGDTPRIQNLLPPLSLWQHFAKTAMSILVILDKMTRLHLGNQEYTSLTRMIHCIQPNLLRHGIHEDQKMPCSAQR